MKTTTIKAGVLKDALKRAITSANGEAATITVGETCFVEVSGHEGYTKITMEAANTGNPGCASIAASVVNHVLAGVARDAEVAFEPFKGGLTIRFAGARLKLKNPEEGVNLFDDAKLGLEKTRLFQATGSELSAVFKSACVFAAKKDIRYYLCGVHIADRNGSLIATATNTLSLHRLTTGIKLNEGSSLGTGGMIIPIRAAEAILSVFDTDEVVTVNQLGDGLLQFNTESMIWVSNLVVGAYPNADAVLIDETVKPTSVRASKKELVLALERVSAISGDRYSRLRMGEGLLEVESIDLEQLSKVPCELIAGKTVEIGMTTELLVEALEAVPTDMVQLIIAGEKKVKAFLRPVDADGTVHADWVATLTPTTI